MAPLVVQLSPYALVTEPEAKAWASINQENIPEGDSLRTLINTASRNIENRLTVEVVSRGLITERHKILKPGTWEIWLLQAPVLSVSELNNDSTREFAAGTIIPATDYILDTERGKIEYTGASGTFPLHFVQGLDVLQVKYWSGVAAVGDVPWDVKGLCLETVAVYFYHLNRKEFSVKQITDDQGNRTYTGFDFLPKPVEKEIKRVKRILTGRITGRRISADSGTPAP
jgi:hypothetical protein